MDKKEDLLFQLMNEPRHGLFVTLAMNLDTGREPNFNGREIKKIKESKIVVPDLLSAILCPDVRERTG